MVQLLIFWMIISLFFLDFLFFRYGIGFRQLTWTPELISIIIAILILFKTALDKQVGIPFKYAVLLFLYLSHILVGFLLNEVPAWTVLAGLRIYTKFLPIFLLPIIFPLSEKEFKRIFGFLYFLAMIQLPVVVYQRFVEFAFKVSGDKMGGTLGAQASGVLSIFMLIVLSFLIAFYFKDFISFRLFLFSFAVAFLPTTLNETKITFLLLPISLIFPAIFLRDKTEAIIRISLAVILLTSSFFILKEIYNYFQKPYWGYGIETFIATPGRVEQYSTARLDPIRFAIENAQKDIRYSIFGHGAGNVSEGFTALLSGKYVEEGIFYGAKTTAFTKSIWEIGFLGIFLLFLFTFFIFWDSLRLSQLNGFVGAYALGMLSYCVFFSLSFVYTDTIGHNILMYPFTLAAGYIAFLSKEKKAEKEVWKRDVVPI